MISGIDIDIFQSFIQFSFLNRFEQYDITLSIEPSLALPRLEPDLPSAIDISRSKSHPLWGYRMINQTKLIILS